MEHELLSGAPELVWIPVESGAETHTGPARYSDLASRPCAAQIYDGSEQHTVAKP